SKAQNLQDGLIAYYPFNGNANDESGNGNNGQEYGVSPTTDRFGNLNSAYFFDGIDDYINIGNVINDNRSVSVWFNPAFTIDNTISSRISLVVRNTSNEYDEFTLLIEDHDPYKGKVAFGRRINYDPHGIGSNSDLWLADNWYHVVSVIDPSEGMKLYINGILQDDIDNTSTEPMAVRAEYSAIGRWGNSDNRYFHGKIDDVRIYDKALTEEEVLSLYHENGWTGDEGLIAYYPFNGNANDESGNNHNGTVYEAVLSPDRFGNPQSAYSFDGIDDYISTFEFSEDLFSISYWIKTQISKSQYPFSNITNAYDGIGMYTNSGGVAFASGGDVWGVISTLAFGSLDDNQWHHIVGIYDHTNNSIKIYIDNTYKLEESFSSFNYSSTLFIGKRGSLTGDFGHHFDGSIDDFKIYNYALSESEIHQLYPKMVGPVVNI
ncbi:MAG: LamG domain-containing protein, partial [Candidatus Kariarchaeaceae archaeon]